MMRATVCHGLLIQQLRDLETKKVVQRTIYQEIPAKVDYRLTSLGEALRPALLELVRWSKLRRENGEEKSEGSFAF